MNSRRKGKDGELELAALLRDYGFDARRGRQYQGGDDSPDIVHSIPGIHLECKRCERGNPYDWLAQADAECPIEAIPVVAHRRSRQQWIAMLDLGDFLSLIRPR